MDSSNFRARLTASHRRRYASRRKEAAIALELEVAQEVFRAPLLPVALPDSDLVVEFKNSRANYWYQQKYRRLEAVYSKFHDFYDRIYYRYWRNERVMSMSYPESVKHHALIKKLEKIFPPFNRRYPRARDVVSELVVKQTRHQNFAKPREDVIWQFCREKFLDVVPNVVRPSLYDMFVPMVVQFIVFLKQDIPRWSYFNQYYTPLKEGYDAEFREFKKGYNSERRRLNPLFRY
jgi:hypothetical protein